MKASQKMLGVRRTSSSFLDLLGSGGAVGQPAQLQLHLTRKPEWGQDLLLKLHARRVADQAHPQGPIHLVVGFCAQTLLHNGGTRQPLWRQKVHLTLDFGEGEYEAGLEWHLQGRELGAMNKSPPVHTHTHTHTHTHSFSHTLGSEAAVDRRLNARYYTSDATTRETQQ